MSKPVHRFVAVARAAQHCPELFARGPAPVDLAPCWAALGARLAESLPARLAPVLGGPRPAIALQVDASTPSGLLSAVRIGRADASEAFELAIEGAGILRLIDRAFGGRGEVSEPLPAELPPSAKLITERIAAAVCAALAEALGIEASELGFAGSPAKDEGAQVRLALIVGEPRQPDWHLWLALPEAALAGWLGGGPRRARSNPARSADPAAAPFAGVPLPLSARLVDMRLPLNTVAGLAPGMVLPVAVARAVPLEAGGVVIARGTVGNQDDRIAIKLTQIA